MIKNAMNAITSSTPNAAPIPIPAFAPVESPELPPPLVAGMAVDDEPKEEAVREAVGLRELVELVLVSGSPSKTFGFLA